VFSNLGGICINWKSDQYRLNGIIVIKVFISTLYALEMKLTSRLLFITLLPIETDILIILFYFSYVLGPSTLPCHIRWGKRLATASITFYSCSVVVAATYLALRNPKVRVKRNSHWGLQIVGEDAHGAWFNITNPAWYRRGIVDPRSNQKEIVIKVHQLSYMRHRELCV
jgi:hypothetical protein